MVSLSEKPSEESPLAKMYRLSKRNVTRDKKAAEFLKKAEEEIKQAELEKEQTRVAKDLKTELILQIFKEEEQSGPELDPTKLTMNRINIKVKASETTFELVSKLKQNREPEPKPKSLTSSSIFSQMEKRLPSH